VDIVDDLLRDHGFYDNPGGYGRGEAAVDNRVEVFQMGGVEPTSQDSPPTHRTRPTPSSLKSPINRRTRATAIGGTLSPRPAKAWLVTGRRVAAAASDLPEHKGCLGGFSAAFSPCHGGRPSHSLLIGSLRTVAGFPEPNAFASVVDEWSGHSCPSSDS